MLELLGRRIYPALPMSFKCLCGRAPYKLIAGRCYRETLRHCELVDSWSRQDVLEYQTRRLKTLLQFVGDEVPFYEKYRGKLDRYEPFDVLQELPIVSKSTVQEHFRQFIPRTIRRIPHHVMRTNGSSGNQLEFYEDGTTYSREMGFMHAQWKRVGYSPRCRKATFRAVAFQRWRERWQAGIFWQLNPVHNELLFSPFHMSEPNLRAYVDRLLDYRPEFVHGYPSAIDALAEYVLRQNMVSQMPPIRAALLGSERCSKTQRDRIEAAFRTRVYTWYGHSERTVLGGECAKSQTYHFFPNYGITEILRPDGDRCRIGESGEIVGTGFLNRSMPLIRYRTDDYATVQEPHCECGRSWDRASDVIGRRSIEGYVVGKSGARISAAALEPPSDAFRNVVRLQYYQKKIGELRIRVLVNPQFSSVDQAAIIDVHVKRMYGEMDVVVDVVKEIPLTGAGKQRWIICDIGG